MARAPGHWDTVAEALEEWARRGIHVVTADEEDPEARPRALLRRMGAARAVRPGSRARARLWGCACRVAQCVLRAEQCVPYGAASVKWRGACVR